MKLLSLNTWGGKVFDPFIDFIKEQSKTVDVFCFQEMASAPELQNRESYGGAPENLLKEMEEILPDYQVYFAPYQDKFNWRPVDFNIYLGNAMFVRKNIDVVEDGHVFVHLERNALHLPDAQKGDWYTMPRLVQYLQVKGVDSPITFFNFHGLWHTSGKGDIPARFEQSRKVAAFLEKFEGKKILCGDFNLDIESESLRMLEKDMKNLIKEKKIPTTRSKTHYLKIDQMPFADYVLISPEINVQNFSVPQLDVSDHLPMILEFA